MSINIFMEIISEKEYEKKVYENGFSFKNRFNLFKDGFRNSSKGLFSLFVSYCLWVLVFGLVVMGSNVLFTQDWYYSNNKQFLQTQDLTDYLIAWQLFFFAGLLYNSQQLFVVNNLLKVENLIDNKKHFFGLFGLFIKQTPLLIWTSVVLGTLFFISLYCLGVIFILINNDKAVDVSFLSYFFSLKGLFMAFGILISLMVLYFNMLSITLIYISDGLKPLKINIFKKTYRAFIKIVKMFDLIMLTIIGHIFVLLILTVLMTYLGVFVYEILFDKFILSTMIDEVKKLKEQEIVLASVFLIIPLYGLFQTYLNRARIRSLALMFIMTEDQEEYNDRLTHPVK